MDRLHLGVKGRQPWNEPRQVWFPSIGSVMPSCASLGKSVHLSEPRFSSL